MKQCIIFFWRQIQWFFLIINNVFYLRSNKIKVYYCGSLSGNYGGAYVKIQRMKKYLTDYPHLMQEFHFGRNGDLKPESLTHGSDKKVWWKCKEGHRNRIPISRFRMHYYDEKLDKLKIVKILYNFMNSTRSQIKIRI